MRDDPARSQYLDVLLALRKVNNGVFGLQLNPDWQHHLASLKSAFSILTSSQGMPLTPKFHVITVHIKQWVEMSLRSLGMESEQSGESLHHVWRILLESRGEVKDKGSEAHMEQVLRCLIKLNSDHV